MGILDIIEAGIAGKSGKNQLRKGRNESFGSFYLVRQLLQFALGP